MPTADGPPPPTLAVALRTRALWLLIRAIPNQRLRALRTAPAWSQIDRVLRRGDLQVLGGIVPRLRLSAAHFDYASGIAYAFLMGSHEPMVQEALRRTVWPGGVVLDLGASTGPFTLLAAWLVGPRGVVISVEPQRASADAISAHARANGFDNVRVIQAAVGSQTDDIDMVVTSDPLWTITAIVGDHPLQTAREHVQVHTVDELVATGAIPAPDVIKMDVEGSELDVLAGMPKLLSDRRPTIIAEMHDHNAEFAHAIAAYGYETTNLDGPQPVEEAGPNIHVMCVPGRG